MFKQVPKETIVRVETFNSDRDPNFNIYFFNKVGDLLHVPLSTLVVLFQGMNIQLIGWRGCNVDNRHCLLWGRGSYCVYVARKGQMRFVALNIFVDFIYALIHAIVMLLCS